MTKMTISGRTAFLIARTSPRGRYVPYQDGTALSPTEFLIHSNPELYPDRAASISATPLGCLTFGRCTASRARTQHWMSNPGISIAATAKVAYAARRSSEAG